MTGVAPLSFFSSLILLLFGALFFYAAVFWETARKHLSPETQSAIGRFAQSRITRFGMLFLVLETLILSPFIEQHRWPFSYPADPAVYAQIDSLKSELGRRNSAFGPEKELADKWRFAKLLRDATSTVCHYQLAATPRMQSSVQWWDELLRMSGWVGDVQTPTNSNLIQPGIALRIPTASSICSSTLQRALSDLYSNPPSKVVANQQLNCTGDCVVIEMNY